MDLGAAATAGAVSAEGARLRDRAIGEPAGSETVSVATADASATPAAPGCLHGKAELLLELPNGGTVSDGTVGAAGVGAAGTGSLRGCTGLSLWT